MQLICGDCLVEMKKMDANSIDTVITDPPYGLKFMGKDWDHGIPGIPYWEEVLRVAKPGAFLLAFGGTRTFHRLTCAIEDAGWEIRDCMMWLYGSGFPKGHDISKAIDKAAGAEREVVGRYDSRSAFDGGQRESAGVSTHTFQNMYGTIPITAPATDAAKLWDGWNVALKPAWEPIIVAMKPIEGTYAENALRWGVAGLNVDGARVGMNEQDKEMLETKSSKHPTGVKSGFGGGIASRPHPKGRWPANLILDEQAAAMLDETVGERISGSGAIRKNAPGLFGLGGDGKANIEYSDSGGPSRFFKVINRFKYCAKASRRERGEGCTHPTVKPLALMEYLCTLTRTPTGGIVLDPFAGSFTTGVACVRTGRDFIGIEIGEDYCEIGRRRIEHEKKQGRQLSLTI